MLDISGEAVFNAGVIRFDLGYIPQLGDRFTFLTADGGISGLGTVSYQFSGTTGGLTSQTEIVGDQLIATAVPQPAALLLMMPGIFALIRRCRYLA